MTWFDIMTVDEIKAEVRDLLDDLAAPLSPDRYRELIEALLFDMQCRLDCLDEEADAGPNPAKLP
jgi:hypothetical protein